MPSLSRIRVRLEASFWFVPALVVLGSISAAVALVEAHSLSTWDAAGWSPRLFGAGADGSRAMLSAIATSMVTVAGVVFSITIVALSLTSTQYSPRVLRNFMRDRPTQVVLGVFVGIFAYCLVVLRTIRGGDEGAFIPSMAVLGGMLYALAGISLLIFFIHHVALSIQSSSILARIAADTAQAIDRMFPEELGSEPEPDDPMPELPTAWVEIMAHRSGYVVAVDGDGLFGLAGELDRVVRLDSAVGSFVAEGTPLAAISGTAVLRKEDEERVRACMQLGSQRTIEQDVGFGLGQLVDVALRALSPGVNDPTTASMCVDQLSALLVRIGRRSIPAGVRLEQGRLRLVMRTPDFRAHLETALLPVILNTRGNMTVLRRLVPTIELLAQAAQGRPDRLKQLQPVARQLQHAVGALDSRKTARLLQRRLRDCMRTQDQEALAGTGRNENATARVAFRRVPGG